MVGRLEWGRASFDRSGGLEVGRLLTSNGADGAASSGSKARARCSSGASFVSATETNRIQVRLTVASSKVCQEVAFHLLEFLLVSFSPNLGNRRFVDAFVNASKS